MALTDAQKNALENAVKTKITAIKSSLSALIFTRDDKFYELLEKSFSYKAIETGTCENNNFKELFELVMNPGSEIFIEKDNIIEAKKYVYFIIQSLIKEYNHQLVQTKLAIQRAEEAKEKEKLEEQQQLNKLIEESSCYYPYAITEDAFNDQYEIIRMSEYTEIVYCRPLRFANYDVSGEDDTQKLKKAINQHNGDTHNKTGGSAISVIFKFKNHKDYKTFEKDPKKNLHLIDKYYTPLPPDTSFDGIIADGTQLKEHDGAKLSSISKNPDPLITPLLDEIEKLIRYLKTQLDRLLKSDHRGKYLSFSSKLEEINIYKDKIEKRRYYFFEKCISPEKIRLDINKYKESIKNIANWHQDIGLKYIIKFNFWRNPKSLNDFNAAFPEQPVNQQNNRRLLGN